MIMKIIPVLPDSLRTESHVSCPPKSEVSASPWQPAVVGQPQVNDAGAAEEKFSLNLCLLVVVAIVVHRSLPPVQGFIQSDWAH